MKRLFAILPYLVMVCAYIAVPVAVLIYGNALFLGLKHYFVPPIAILVLCALTRPGPFFLAGVAVSVAITFFIYFSINWVAVRPDGLLGLGHIFSLPGLLLGAVSSAIAQRKRLSSPISAFLLGIAGACGGFLLFQLSLCNALMYCGPLSLFQ